VSASLAFDFAAPLPAAPPDPPVALPVALPTLTDLRALLVSAQRALDDLLWIAGDAMSVEPASTPEARRLDLDRFGREILDNLRAASTKVDALSALFRLAEERPIRAARKVDRAAHVKAEAGAE
jgi:hypothetical protein